MSNQQHDAPEHIAASVWAERQRIGDVINIGRTVLQEKIEYYFVEANNPERSERSRGEIKMLLGHMTFEMIMRDKDMADQVAAEITELEAAS